jgi:hypothetical protein
MENLHQKESTSINLVSNLSSVLQNIFSLKDDYLDDEEELKYCFKILLFDDKVFTILSPLLKIFFIREYNISLTLNIKDPREKMQDIMAIYIIYLTKENLDYLYSDIKNRIFDNFYINFIVYDISAPENTKLLENFYNDISNLDNNSSIYKISIIPIDLFLYHPQIFSLNLKKPYLLLNSPNISDDVYQNYLTKISNGIFSALFLMKTYPIVKYHKGFFGDDIIKKIQTSFNYLFKTSPEIKEEFKVKKNSKRTLLLILDRDIDLPIMLHHACSFGAMVHDCFGINIGGENNDEKNIYNKNTKNIKFQLDPINDYVWNEKLQEVFVDVGKYVYQEYKNYYKEMDFLDKINKPKDFEELQNESKQLAKSIETLRDKKLIGNILSQESKIFEELNNIQNSKKLDEIFLMECNLLKKKEKINDNMKKEFFKLLHNYKDKPETQEDIYRLSLLFYLCNSKNMTKEDIIYLKPYIMNKNSLNYLKKKLEENTLRENNNLNMGSNTEYKRNNSMIMKGLFSAFNTISNLMSIEQPSNSADLIDKLVRNQNIANWVTYDFITKNIENSANYYYDNIICFFIGGGSFGEYEYIYDLMAQNKYNIYYGTDYIYRPIEFVQDLEELGKINNNDNI